MCENAFHQDDNFPHPIAVPTIEEYPTQEDLSELGKEKWLHSANLAHYLGFPKFAPISVPITVNLLLIGFSGDGDSRIDLSSDHLLAWFSHLEHTLGHVIAPIGEYETTTKRQPISQPFVSYSIRWNIVKICPLVNTLLEDALLWNLRPEEQDFQALNGSHKHNQFVQKESPRFYINAFRFSGMIDSLLDYLNLTASYSLLILNPNSPVKLGEHYGYRFGFSESEIRILHEQKKQTGLSMAFADLAAVSTANTMTTKTALSSSAEKSTEKTKPKHLKNRSGVTISNLVHSSEEWARWFLQTQRMIERPSLKDHSEKSDASRKTNHHLPLWDPLPSEKRSIVDVAKQIISNGSFEERKYLYQVLNSQAMHEDCLSDVWISHQRFAFIDLTAGPFAWGPTISGEGTRTIHTLPSVLRVSNSSLGHVTIPLNPRNRPLQSRYESSAAERELLQTFLSRYCINHGDDSTIENRRFCQDLQERMQRFKSRNEELSKESIGSENASDLNESVSILEGGESEGADAFFELDDFLSELGSTISGALRHIVLPANPLFQATFSERVTFDLFLIADHQDFDPLAIGNFDFELYKQEISRLKLPGQQFIFTMKKISMKEDIAVSMAFASSLRVSSWPKLNVDGEFSTEIQFYLDSKELQNQMHVIDNHAKHFWLKPKFEEDSNDDWNTDEDSDRYEHFVSRHIPLFLFSVNRTPLFIDKQYMAKALSDMVIVVQSNTESYETRLSCNGKPIYWNLRNPLKFVLSASALLLGGLIPSHLTYNEATETIQQNWLWSVGDNPLSYTSSLSHFSEFHRDIIFRNYIVYELNQSITLMNLAMDHLAVSKPSLQNLGLLEYLPLKNLTETLHNVKRLWNRITTSMQKFDVDNCIKNAKELRTFTRRFFKLAKYTERTLSMLKCLDSDSSLFSTFGTIFILENWKWLWPICIGWSVLIVFMLFTYKSSNKVKLN